MTFEPTGDRILVKPDAAIEHATISGIVIAPRDGKIIDSQQQLGRTGVVVAVGPGKKTRKGEILPMEVSIGDHVAFGEFMFQRVKLNGEEHFLLQDKDITMVMEKDDAAGKEQVQSSFQT